MCLSYCWGTAKFLKTTNENLDDHKKEIPWDNLPPVFRDTILIARAFGIHYLWIDALCIIQDATRDWEQESKLMAEIYRNSCLTVAAVSSADPHQSYFSGPKSRTFIGPVISVLNHHFPNSTVDPEIKVYPMLSRAWTYQERLLSPRVLYIGQQEMLWDCSERRTCQCGRSAHMLDEVRKDDFYNTCLQPGSDLSSMQRIWYHMVIQYSSLYLTQPEDKLPAISGLANVMHRHRGKSYLAGLWEDTLLVDLCWYVRKRADPSPSFSSTVPTWSWASVGGIIKYFYPLYFGQYSIQYREHAKVEKAVCLPDGPSATGRVKKGGYINLECDLIPIPWVSPASLEIEVQGTNVIYVDDARPDSPGDVRLDFQQALYFIPLSSVLFWGKWYQQGIVVMLKPGTSKRPEYQRIGYAKGSPDLEYFAAKQQIRLV